jgi:hypothetical protein
VEKKLIGQKKKKGESKMKIYTPENNKDVIIALSPLEYRRLYQIIEDHAIEYGTSGDMIFDMLQTMDDCRKEE